MHRYNITLPILLVAFWMPVTVAQQHPANMATSATPQQATPPVHSEPAAATEAPRTAAELGMYVYPKSGQSTTQQVQDEAECYAWAQQHTGIDPTAASADTPQPAGKKGGVVKGAAGAASERVQTFNKAMASCLEGHNYAVR